MVTVTDPKVSVLAILSNNWLETANANLPTVVGFNTNFVDRRKQEPQVVVGPRIQTEQDWFGSKEILYKAVVDVHTFVLPIYARQPDASYTAMGTLKKNIFALNENVRTICLKHMDRPSTDIMHIIPMTRAREIAVNHHVQEIQAWYTDTMT